MRTYTSTQIDGIIEKYIVSGGEIIVIEEGTLGHGFLICLGEGLKTAIIREQYVNEWTSTHTLRMYNKTPKKYVKMINEHIT